MELAAFHNTLEAIEHLLQPRPGVLLDFKTDVRRMLLRRSIEQIEAIHIHVFGQVVEVEFLSNHAEKATFRYYLSL